MVINLATLWDRLISKGTHADSVAMVSVIQLGCLLIGKLGYIEGKFSIKRLYVYNDCQESQESHSLGSGITLGCISGQANTHNYRNNHVC